MKMDNLIHHNYHRGDPVLVTLVHTTISKVQSFTPPFWENLNFCRHLLLDFSTVLGGSSVRM